MVTFKRKIKGLKEKEIVMKIQGEGIERVRLVTKDNLEGIMIGILCRRIFKERAEIELVNNFNIFNNEEYSRGLEPVKSLLISGRGLEESIKEELENTCRRKEIKFKYFLNDYRENTKKYIRTESLGDFIESFRGYVKIEKKIEEMNPLIEALLTGEDLEKRIELVKLMNIIGKRRFIERFYRDESLEMSEDEKSLVLLESERMEREIFRLIKSSLELEIKDRGKMKKARLSFSNPINPIYSDYYLSQILKRDSSVAIGILMELPESIKIKFREGEFSEELMKRFRGNLIGGEEIIRSNLRPFGIKKVAFEFLRFYGIETKF